MSTVERRAAPSRAPGEPAWVGEVLDFWFGELAYDQWWDKDPAVDAQVCARFLPLHERLAQDGLRAGTPREALAAVIALDQFPRHLFRDDPRAYATDPLARGIAIAAIDAGFDADMADAERMFLYMPLQHSEDAGDQARALALMQALGHDGWTRFAVAHKRIIERFGRFPHRNAVLGRVSTAEEIASLDEPMGSF